MTQRKESGEYSTPKLFSEFIASLTQKHGSRVLELNWQNDEFLSAIDSKQPGTLDIWGATTRNTPPQSKYKIIESELLVDPPHLERDSFDVVVINPPWGVRLPELSKRSKIKNLQGDSVSLYIEWATWYVKSGGLLLCVVSSGFLYNLSSKPIRDFLLDGFQVRGVFEFKPSIVYGVSISTAVICLQKAKSDEQDKPECFMAEIHTLNDLPKICELYNFTSRIEDSKSSFQIGLTNIGNSRAFTSKLNETFSPAHTYFTKNISDKLKQFRTVTLSEIADIQVGFIERKHNLDKTIKAKSSCQFLNARNISKEGIIVGNPLHRETAENIEKFQLLTGDILIRTIQSSTNSPSSSTDNYEGIIVAVVPQKFSGTFYDQTLIRVRLKDNPQSLVTPNYIAQLFRNEFVISGFNQVVLEQILFNSSVLSNFTRILPSLIRDIKIPLMPKEIFETQPQESQIERVQRLGRNIDEVTDAENKLKNIFCDYWGLITSDDVRLFLVTGEWLFSKNRNADIDYSGIGIEFCKAVEVELWKRIGLHLGSKLRKRGVTKFPFWNVDKEVFSDRPNTIKSLEDEKVQLGKFVGFVWGLIKLTKSTIRDDDRRDGMRIQEIIRETSPRPELLEENKIPQLLKDLHQYRNGSAHKDKLERWAMEELYKIVIPHTLEQSIIVQLIEAFPLPSQV